MHENSILSGVYYLNTTKDGWHVFVKEHGEQEIFTLSQHCVSEYNYVTSRR